MLVKIRHNGSNYRFYRDRKSIGRWEDSSHMIVHRELHNELTLEARHRGLSEMHNFADAPPKKVKEKAEKGTRRKRKRGVRRSKTGIRIELSF